MYIQHDSFNECMWYGTCNKLTDGFHDRESENKNPSYYKIMHSS